MNSVDSCPVLSLIVKRDQEIVEIEKHVVPSSEGLCLVHPCMVVRRLTTSLREIRRFQTVSTAAILTSRGIAIGYRTLKTGVMS